MAGCEQLGVPQTRAMSSAGGAVVNPMSVKDSKTEGQATSEAPASTKEPTTGLFQGETPGFYSGPKLLTFTPGSISSFLSLCRDRDLTVCSYTREVLFHLGCLVYSILLMTVFSRELFWPDGPGCADGTNVQMCQLTGTLEEWKSEFRFLIAFLLAGFVARSVSMWERRRTNYASLCGNARNFNVQVAGLLPVDENDTELNATRATLGRWIMLAFELAMFKARGKIDAEEARDFLLQEGLLEPGEWEKMVDGDRHTTVFWWLQFRLSRLADQGVLSENRLEILSSCVTATRAQANDLMSSLDRDSPFPYAHICGLLVSINVWIMCTFKGLEWAMWMRFFGGDLFAQPKFYVDLITLVAWNVSYKSLYDLCYVLHNPFGDRRIDVAHETIGSGIRNFSKSVTGPQQLNFLPPGALGASPAK